MLSDLGDPAGARDNESLSIRREIGGQVGTAISLTNVLAETSAQDEYGRARVYLNRLVGIMQALDDA